MIRKIILTAGIVCAAPLIALACEADGAMSDDNKVNTSKSVYQSLMARDFIAPPKEIMKDVFLIGLKDGNTAAVVRGGDLIIVNPVFVGTKGGSFIDTKLVLDSFPPIAEKPQSSSGSIPPRPTPLVPPTVAQEPELIEPSMAKGKGVATPTRPSGTFDTSGLHGETLGTGNKEVVVFIDPDCPSCHRFLKGLRYAAIPSSIRFKIVPANLLAGASPKKQRADELLSGDGKNLIEKVLFNKIPSESTEEGVRKAAENRALYAKTGLGWIPSFMVDGEPIKVRGIKLETMLEYGNKVK